MKRIAEKRIHRYAATAAAIAAVVATITPALAEQTGDAVTISLSGSTAIRNFTTSAGFSLLTPGTSITLNSGLNGAPVTYTAPAGPTTQVQLAQEISLLQRTPTPLTDWAALKPSASSGMSKAQLRECSS